VYYLLHHIVRYDLLHVMFPLTICVKLCSYFLHSLHRNNIDDDTHEKYVKLHMDILTYHSRVKNKSEESLRSIKAKVGYVPRDVEEHLQELQRVEVHEIRYFSVLRIFNSVFLHISICFTFLCCRPQVHPWYSALHPLVLL
jgi:hypothetical protein